MRFLPDDNLSYPVLITLEDGGSGSGFFLSDTKNAVYLVTAAHVLYDSTNSTKLRSTRISITSYDKDLSRQDPIVHEFDLTKASIELDSANDVVVIRLGKCIVVDGTEKIALAEGVRVVQQRPGSNIVVVDTNLAIKKFDEAMISNDAVIFGYPVSLGNPKQPQFELHRPLLRKGIIAGKNYSKKRIIIDGAVYFGNSGGLVLECEHLDFGARTFHVVGVVSEYVPFYDVLISKRHQYEHVSVDNSGYAVVVPMDFALDLVAKEEKRVAATSAASQKVALTC